MGATVLLIDLSSIAVPIYKMSASEADPNYTSQQTVARVRALASGVEHVAVCCDSGRSFRHDIAPTYKAQRPESEAPMHHQITLACEALKGDGFPVWSVRGFEADDIIATAVHRALEDADADRHVVIASADKDLLQLVGDRVSVKSLRDGSIIGPAEVKAKFGVAPEQMRDYLVLVGDSSDNVKGVEGVGPKRAAALLGAFGTVREMYEQLRNADGLTQRALGVTPAIALALSAFEPHLDHTYELITLRTDVDIPFDDIFAPRVPSEAATFTDMHEDTMPTDQQSPPAALAQPDAPQSTPETPTSAPTAASAPPPASEPLKLAPKPQPVDTNAIGTQALVPHSTHVEFTKQLEPRDMNEAGRLAKWVYESRQFSAYGTPQAVLATVLAGRELGLQAMASLRSIHIVEGKPTLSADLIRALVLQSPVCEYFRCIERVSTPGEERATFATRRKGEPEMTLTFTIEEGRQMWAKTEDAWHKSTWGKSPVDMCVARASAKLARLVYPDICFGLYTPDELTDGRAA